MTAGWVMKLTTRIWAEHRGHTTGEADGRAHQVADLYGP